MMYELRIENSVLWHQNCQLSPAVPPTHPETTSTTGESVWASLLNNREDLRPGEETPNQTKRPKQDSQREDEKGEEKETKEEKIKRN